MSRTAAWAVDLNETGFSDPNLTLLARRIATLQQEVAGLREQPVSEAKRLDSTIMAFLHLQANLTYANQRIANLEQMLGATRPLREVDEHKWPDWPEWPCSCGRGKQ